MWSNYTRGERRTLEAVKKLDLNPCPDSGEGVHSWIWHVASTYYAAGVGMEEAKDYCELHATRALQPNEVENAFISLQNRSNIERNRWPKKSAYLTGVAIEEAKREAGLAAEIIGCLNSGGLGEIETHRILERLYPDNPLICCGKTTWLTQTKPLSEFTAKYLSECQFIVPNPMSSATGTTQAGKPSNRSLQNTGPRQYLVVEFDEGSHEDHAALLQCLDGYEECRLCLALTSGNKSLHGWFDVRRFDEERAKTFFKKALMLGADRATWTRSQLVRMPNGTRVIKTTDQGVLTSKQTVLHYHV